MSETQFPDGRRMFTVEAAADYLRSIGVTGASVNTIRALIVSCKLPHQRIGRRFYVSRTALDAWLQHHERMAK